MPTLLRVPSYRLHKARGLAVVTLDGRDFYLGEHGTDDSRERYNALISEWMKRANSAAPLTAPTSPRSSLTIGELALKYIQHASRYYTKNGVPTSQIHVERAALRAMVQLYEHEYASEFGALKLKSVQQLLIGQGMARNTINKLCASIKRAFKWAAAEELVPASVFHGLEVVEGLKRGRCGARETPPVLPVDDGTVANTLPYLSPVIKAMVQLQRLCGARPGEVIGIRPVDVTMQTNGVWVLRPSSHKTEHHDRERRVYIGPEGQDILRPYLERDPMRFCFDPGESAGRNNRKPNGRRRPGACFTTSSYRRAIERACEKAFDMPENLRKIPADVSLEDRARLETEAAEWRRANCWAPNQLRHSAATRIREQYGVEAAQTVLGHSDPRMTTVYAERHFALAADVALKIG